MLSESGHLMSIIFSFEVFRWEGEEKRVGIEGRTPMKNEGLSLPLETVETQPL